MNNDILERKLKYLFHDPINKPFILMQTKTGHEELAKKYAEMLNISLPEDMTPDHISSAMERMTLPSGSKYEIKFIESPEIVHTLSGAKLENINTLKNQELVKITNDIVEKTMNEIKATVKDYDLRKKYLYIWRNLMPLLRKNSSKALAAYWEIVPADTRVPDHSIFQHLKTTAMCAFSGKTEDKKLLHKNTLFLFSIGPVQSFIKNARKSADLYWGSFTLSYLNWIAIKEVIKIYGPDSVIFPDLLEQPLVDKWLEEEVEIKVLESNGERWQEPTIPNRFFALIPEKEGKEIKLLGARLQDAVKKEIRKIAEFVGSDLNDDLKEKTEEQLLDYFKSYWVGLTIQNEINEKPEGTDIWQTADYYKEFLSRSDLDELKKKVEDSYRDIEEKRNNCYKPNIGTVYVYLYKVIERMMGSRKNFRLTSFIEESGNKCDICGEYTVTVKANNINIGFQRNIMKEGEELCSICYMKRILPEYFSKKKKIPSISEITLANFLDKVKDEDKFNSLKNMLGDIYDPQIFYNENMQEFLEESSMGEKYEPINRILNDLIMKMTSDKGALPKYYAVIAMDGDNMGKWLSGKIGPNSEKIFHSKVVENTPKNDKSGWNEIRPVTPAVHLEISSALKNYSLLFVKDIVEKKNRGKVIYAGGDDVLALINLENLLKTMKDLRLAYEGKISDDNAYSSGGFTYKNNKIVKVMGPLATISAGVCIAHYKEPLQKVIETARQMEKEAKKDEKDSFAIKMIKHSGEVSETVFKWKDCSNENAYFIDELISLQKVMREDNLSSSFYYDIHDEFRRLLPDSAVDTIKIQNNHSKNDLNKIIIPEIKRIVKRKKNTDIKPDSSEEKKIIRIVENIYNNSANFNNFISACKIIRLIAKGVE